MSAGERFKERTKLVITFQIKETINYEFASVHCCNFTKDRGPVHVREWFG